MIAACCRRHGRGADRDSDSHGLTLLLLVDSDFTRNAGEYVAVVLMAAAGGLLIAAAQDCW
jgi:hypothetical protein